MSQATIKLGSSCTIAVIFLKLLSIYSRWKGTKLILEDNPFIVLITLTLISRGLCTSRNAALKAKIGKNKLIP